MWDVINISISVLASAHVYHHTHGGLLSDSYLHLVRTKVVISQPKKDSPNNLSSPLMKAPARLVSKGWVAKLCVCFFSVRLAILACNAS